MNEIVEWTDKGIEYEADQRQAQIMKEQLCMKSDSKGVVTPGAKGITVYEAADLDLQRVHKFRAVAARGNYLCQDRSAIQFSVKELCRAMSAPKDDDWNKLKRLGRYLVGKSN